MATATETKGQKVRFASKYTGLVLTRIPERTVRDEFGNPRTISRSDWIAQREEDNRKRVANGLDPEPIDRSPWKVEFDNTGNFETDDPVLIDFLRNHDKFGVDAPSGFDEIPPSAEELRPTPQERFQEIAAAQRIEDEGPRVDALADILQDEKATHNRPVVIQATDAALLVATDEPAESEGDAETGNGASQSPSANS